MLVDFGTNWCKVHVAGRGVLFPALLDGDFNCVSMPYYDLMSVTHVPQIGTENPYQKTGIINRHREHCPIRYRKPAPISGTCVIGIRLHVMRTQLAVKSNDEI